MGIVLTKILEDRPLLYPIHLSTFLIHPGICPLTGQLIMLELLHQDSLSEQVMIVFHPSIIREVVLDQLLIAVLFIIQQVLLINYLILTLILLIEVVVEVEVILLICLRLIPQLTLLFNNRVLIITNLLLHLYIKLLLTLLPLHMLIVNKISLIEGIFIVLLLLIINLPRTTLGLEVLVQLVLNNNILLRVIPLLIIMLIIRALGTSSQVLLINTLLLITNNPLFLVLLESTRMNNIKKMKKILRIMMKMLEVETMMMKMMKKKIDHLSFQSYFWVTF